MISSVKGEAGGQVKVSGDDERILKGHGGRELNERRGGNPSAVDASKRISGRKSFAAIGGVF